VVVKVMKREKQTAELATGSKCRKVWSGKFIGDPALQLLGVPIETRQIQTRVAVVNN
jgi:hypothetical protein